MLNLRQILAATDFSAYSGMAESRAALLCKDMRLERLELLTVQCSRLRDMLANKFRRTKASQDAAISEWALENFMAAESRIASSYGVRCRCAVRIGDVVAEVLSASEAISADLIVIGNSRKGGIRGLLGNTADRLIRLSSRPVLLVRKEPAAGYREVLVPVDFSPESRQAALLALEMAPDAHIVFLHAFRVWVEGQMREAGVNQDVINGYRVMYGERARRELNQFVEELGPVQQLVSRVVEFGWAAPVIASCAKKMAPDLIVMGKHSGSMVEEFLIGSVTRRTIEQTGCDVLITPRHDPGNDYWYKNAAA